jgi:hypothetical protein
MRQDLYLLNLTLAFSLHRHSRHVKLKDIVQGQLAGKLALHRIEMPWCLGL